LIITDCHEGWHISFSVVSALAGGFHFPLSHACSCETRPGCTESMFTRLERHVLLNEPQRTTSDPLPYASIVMSKVMDLVTWPVLDNDLDAFVMEL
jgi:hypothetical protein